MATSTREVIVRAHTQVTTRILAPRVLRLAVTCVAFGFLAINPIIHPLELLVLVPLAFITPPRFRWLVPTTVIALPLAFTLHGRLFPSPTAFADHQLAIVRKQLPLTAAQQMTLWQQYYDFKRK